MDLIKIVEQHTETALERSGRDKEGVGNHERLCCHAER